MTATNCKHENVAYYPATNEEGWKCLDCPEPLGEPEGYSPQLDRSHIYDKVNGLLLELHESKFIHVSNGTGGDVLTEAVVKECQRSGLYDQVSIMQYILALGEEGHAAYWKEIGDGIIAGNDPRDRCGCGQLATSSCGKQKSCSKCSIGNEAR